MPINPPDILKQTPLQIRVSRGAELSEKRKRDLHLYTDNPRTPLPVIDLELLDPAFWTYINVHGELSAVALPGAIVDIKI